MMFLKSPKISQSWPRLLWAQRSGAINFQGIYPQIKGHNTCPLCATALSTGLTWHILLECRAPGLQTLYQDWATKAETEWDSLLSLLSLEQKQHLDFELHSPRLRGTSYRGIEMGWLDSRIG